VQPAITIDEIKPTETTAGKIDFTIKCSGCQGTVSVIAIDPHGGESKCYEGVEGAENYNITVQNSQIKCQCNLLNKPSGEWKLKVINPDGEFAVHTFSVRSQGESQGESQPRPTNTPHH